MESDSLVLGDNKKNEKKEVVLTPPACVEGKTSENIDRKAPNILQFIFSLFSNVRLGSDLTHFQVSHHSPVTALHATDESNNVELIWCQYATPKFYGTFVEGKIQGKRRLNLLEKGESYVMQAPNLEYRLLPKPSVVWVGNVNIKCQETGLEAHLSIKSGSFLGFGGSNSETIKGKIIDSYSSNKLLYEIHGRWDRIVYIKDMTNGKTKVLHNAKETMYALPTPILTDPEGVWESESAAVWTEVSKSIINKEWDKAREAKQGLEEKERRLLRQRKSMGENWIPKHFNLFHNPQFGWDCSPKQKFVPPAPINLTL